MVPGGECAGFRLVGLLRSVGGVEIWKAVRRDGYPVALKLAAEGSAAAHRLAHETAALRLVASSGTTVCEEVGSTDGFAYLALDWCGGGSLKEELRRRTPTVVEIRRIAIQVLHALQDLERAQVVHRDIKPSNLLLTDEGDVRLADFGVALLPGEAPSRTRPVGTDGYMSPEQIACGSIDGRSDLYSLGRVLSDLLNGRPDVPAALGRFVARLTERNPAFRPPTAAFARAELLRLGEDGRYL